jgi:hypothetical protein
LTQQRHIFLVPGFFGFANLGDLRLFSHVESFLGAVCHELEFDVAIHAVPTSPTASIRERAVELLEAIVSGPAGEGGEIYLVGHGTGGLDARLLVTPHVSLRTERDVAEVAGRVRKVVTVATPHHGTPLSAFFAAIYGRQFVRLLSLMTACVLDTGQVPTEALVELGSAFVRSDGGIGIDGEIADSVYEQLLATLPEDKREPAQELMTRVTSDQALFDQLTTAGIDVFNAATADRDSVRYGCAVASAAPPGLESVSQLGVDPAAQASYGLFAALHRIVGSGSPDSYRGQLSGEQAEWLQSAYDSLPSSRDNDGLVPIHSQLWGQVIHACRADHLDLIGHFGDRSLDPPHHDWLASRSGFDREAFERLWTDVARFVADDEGAAA